MEQFSALIGNSVFSVFFSVFHHHNAMQTIDAIPPAEAVEISVFQNVQSKTAYDYTLQRFIDLTRTYSPRFTPTIEQIRQLPKSDKRYSDLKRTLPAFTLSCRIEQGQGRTTAPKSNNGVVCLDIDQADNPHLTDWGKVRQAVGQLPYCYISALSVGGRGVFAVIGVDPATPHQETFAALQLHFANRYGITIDPACKDIARARYLSYDPGAVVKHPTAIFRVTSTPRPLEKDRPKHRPIATEGDGYDRIRAAVRVWVRKGIALNNYDDWTRAAAALKGIPGGAELFDQISQFAASYKGERETAKKIEQVQGLSRITPATFIHLCDRYGISAEEINAEMRAAAKTEQTQPHKERPKTEPSDEREAEERAKDEQMLKQASAVVDLFKGVYDFKPPTLADIKRLDPSERQEPPPF